MDLTDFSRGIITDVDAQDGEPVALTECINFDIEPGALIKRDGTKTRQWDYSSYDYSTKTLNEVGTAVAGTGIPLADERVIQIVQVYAPDARAESVKGMAEEHEHCLNRDVTVILMQVEDTDTYRVYADFITAGKFIRVPTFDDVEDGWVITSETGEVPYMIPRQSAVAIGNVYPFTVDGTLADDLGVLWCGHIKKLVGWTKDEAGYHYMNAIDEWRLCNAECSDSGKALRCDLLISDFGKVYSAGSDSYNELNEVVDNGAEFILRESIDGWILSQDENRTIDVAVTAMMDGYQETRPLTWEDPLFSLVDTESHLATAFGAASLPIGWTVTPDPLHNQYARIRTADDQSVCYATTEGEGTIVDDPDGEKKFDYKFILRWNRRYTKVGTPDRTGNGFYVNMFVGQLKQLYVKHYNDLNILVGISIAGDNLRTAWGTTLLGKMPRVKAILLGSDFTTLEKTYDPAAIAAAGFNLSDPRVDAFFQWCAANWQDIEQDPIRQQCRLLWTVVETSYDAKDGTGLDTEDAMLGYWFESTDMVDNVRFEFQPGEYAGTGMLCVRPKVTKEHLLELSGSRAALLLLGARRTTGYRLYARVDGIDVDFTLKYDLPFDYNEADPDHGGDANDGAQITRLDFSYREVAFAGAGDSYAPTWMEGEDDILPYFADPFVLEAGFGHHAGIFIRGGINGRFLVGDHLLTDVAGKSTLSANLLRDPGETDAPCWRRGAICDGRLMAVSIKNGDIQFSIVAGGVAQYDIMPSTFHVAKGEKVQHIVSFRGQHHMIFTDQNLWRIDLAQGDEFDWRVLDTFVKQGTIFWHAIVDTPHGIFYPNNNGIWVYDGDTPQNIVRDKWLRAYRPMVANGTVNGVFGGYDVSKANVHFALGTASVYVFDIHTGAWRKYQYEPDITPIFLTTLSGEWIQSFGYGDMRTRDYILKRDYSDAGGAAPFGVAMITQELPPPDETQTMYWQYMGVRYKSATSPVCKLELLTSAYKDLRHPSLHIAVNNNRHEYFFPLPMGFGRGMRVAFAQGEYHGDANSAGDVQLSSISLRGGSIEQWRGTR